MPVILASTYRAPLPFRSADVNTVASSFRRVPDVQFERERVDTEDGDFLDLDWSRVGSGRLGIVSHGLEGNAGRPYMRGMARAFNRRGWDALCWNYRGCSGEMNRLPRFYHSGDTADLLGLVERALDGGYSEVALVGFSLGGNVTLKLLGEMGVNAAGRVTGAVAISTPVDLEAGAEEMMRRRNYFYMQRFLRSLGEKVRDKAVQFPDLVDATGYEVLRGFHDFDERYTAPLHGFDGALDYWRKSSAKGYLSQIRVPTLVINAQDDPFLPPTCYPVEEASSSDYLFLETPAHGGHCGFVTADGKGEWWSETRALTFIQEHADL